MLCWSEWECLLLSGSQLPSEQLKLSSSSSPPFTAGLPHPPPLLLHLMTLPSHSPNRLTHTHAHASVCTENTNTHWTDWGGEALLLCHNSVSVCYCGSGGDWDNCRSHHMSPCCVCFFSLLPFHYMWHRTTNQTQVVSCHSEKLSRLGRWWGAPDVCVTET